MTLQRMEHTLNYLPFLFNILLKSYCIYCMQARQKVSEIMSTKSRELHQQTSNKPLTTIAPGCRIVARSNVIRLCWPLAIVDGSVVSMTQYRGFFLTGAHRHFRTIPNLPY